MKGGRFGESEAMESWMRVRGGKGGIEIICCEFSILFNG